jgi:iron complex outermembrane receptor protein
VSGFDFDASGRFKYLGTDFRLKLDGSYVWKYQDFSVTDNAYDPNITGTWDFGPRLSAVVKLNMKKGDFDHGITMNYTSGYSNNSLSSPTYCTTQKVAPEYLAACEHVGNNVTWDYSLSYTGISHVKLNLYVKNIFEQDAPVQWRDGYSPQFRRVAVAASYTF